MNINPYFDVLTDVLSYLDKNTHTFKKWNIKYFI